MYLRFIISILLVIICQGIPFSASAASGIGVAGAVNTNTFGTPPAKTTRLITLGASIFFNEHIVTDENGLIQILLRDGSTFSMGPSSDLVIDKFVYNPDTQLGEIAATLAKGTLRFIGGKISKARESVSVDTPIATIGIRGGIMLLSHPHGEGEAEYSFHYGIAMDVKIHDGQAFRITRPGQSVRLQISGQHKVHFAKKGKASKKHVEKNSVLKGNKSQAGGVKSKKKVIQQVVKRLNSGSIELLTSPAVTVSNRALRRPGAVVKRTAKRKNRRKRRRRRKF